MIVTQVLQQLLPGKHIETSDKNFNSELGLGLSILHIASYDPTIRGTIKTIFQILGKMLYSKHPYDILVLEYGIDYIGEMDIELSIVRPHISIFTMIDKVHAMNM